MTAGYQHWLVLMRGRRTFCIYIMFVDTHIVQYHTYSNMYMYVYVYICTRT